jgi:hypothetical protein
VVLLRVIFAGCFEAVFDSGMDTSLTLSLSSNGLRDVALLGVALAIGVDGIFVAALALVVRVCTGVETTFVRADTLVADLGLLAMIQDANGPINFCADVERYKDAKSRAVSRV